MTVIGNSAFGGCWRLTSINIPNSVTNIEERAFDGCNGLTSVTIPNSVTSIGDGAFAYCSGLTSVTIPSNVKNIGPGVFSYCDNLTSINVDNSNTVYDSRNNCNAIIKTKTNEVISGCMNTIIPNSVTSIAYYSFGGCRSLTSITIPNSVTSIGDLAFSDCRELTAVTIPNSVTSIGKGVFQQCTGLTAVTSLIREPFEIKDNVFETLGKFTSATLNVPKGTKTKYEATPGWNNFQKIVEIGGSVQPKGDVNGDMTVDVADISSVIDVMSRGGNDAIADVNGDGTVDVADIAEIIDRMAANAKRQSAGD